MRPSAGPARPLFVVGKHRSGTTWLANLLCEIPGIAGVQHPAHYGIHESGYFRYVDGRFGDLRDRRNFDEYVRVMATSDYFRLAGATEEFLESLWPASYEVIFRAVMDRFAASRGATFWLEKSPSHTPLVERIAQAYPDALFVAIRRDLYDVLASTLALWAPGAGAPTRIGKMLLTTASWVYYNKCISDFARRSNRILTVDYRDLCSNTSASLARVCAFVGVPFSGDAPTSRYAHNTSFVEGRESESSALRPGERRVASLTCVAVGLAPVALLKAVQAARRELTGPPSLPGWFFVLQGEDQGPG